MDDKWNMSNFKSDIIILYTYIYHGTRCTAVIYHLNWRRIMRTFPEGYRSRPKGYILNTTRWYTPTGHGLYNIMLNIMWCLCLIYYLLFPWQHCVYYRHTAQATCKELHTVNTHANTVVFSLTASKPNSQVIPRSGSRMTVLLTTVLEEKKKNC